ncbi:MAG: Mo-dependent nitrogenase C-terminal domain-containing protein [Oscillatoriales cyanobacterium C42_A2020_001]|nr:Mo-dependent nitrogenase C-terminal domain-containing protein [Leptolyngbyaceae cyanobacterium C42_A2020_001]
MENAHSTIEPRQGTNLIWLTSEISLNPVSERKVKPALHFNPLKPIRQWLDQMEISDRKMAQTLASLIPAQCPFERTVKLFNRTILYIPPLCKLNPFYEELVGLRFRALCYLADECGEDISSYC